MMSPSCKPSVASSNGDGKVCLIDRRISLSIKQADPNAAKSENNSRPRRRQDSVADKYMNDNDNGFALGDIIGDQLKDKD